MRGAFFSLHSNWLIACALILTSCSGSIPLGRMGEAGIEAPASWSTHSMALHPVDSAWLNRLGDERLAKLIAEALRNNPDLRASASRVDMAVGAARYAAGAMKPTAQIIMQGLRSRRNFVGFPDFGGGGGNGPNGNQSPANPPKVLESLSNSFGPSLDISWELDVWGRLRAGHSAALAQAQAVELDYAAARTSLAAQVAKAWIAHAEASEQAALARDTVATLRQTEVTASERFRSGLAEGNPTGAQLRVAKSDVAAARAQEEQANELVGRTRRQLELLLGRYPAGMLESPATLPELPDAPPAGLPSEILLRRPDILAAERRFAAQGARMKEARLAAFPQFRLTANSGTSTDQLSEILNSDFGVWTLASNIVQPLYTGGRVRAEMFTRKAEERQSLAQLQGTVLKAFGEVENALAAEDYLARQEKDLREAVSWAAEADAEARAAFRDGVGDILTVFSAETRLLQARAQLITLRRLRLDTRINLHLALGGDFKPRAS